MIRRLLCWLGFHAWRGGNPCSVGGCDYRKHGLTTCCWQDANGKMHWCEHQLKCKYCGKVKK